MGYKINIGVYVTLKYLFKTMLTILEELATELKEVNITQQMGICDMNLKYNEIAVFLNRIITRDKTCVVDNNTN